MECSVAFCHQDAVHAVMADGGEPVGSNERGGAAMTEEPLRRFSHSLVEDFLRCPRHAYERYIEHSPEPKGAALIKGSACDHAWNQSLTERIEKGEHARLEDLLEITEQAFRDDVSDSGGVSECDWGDSSPRAELDSALRMTKAWRNQLAPDIVPTAVQVEYHRPLATGRDFIGFVDYEGSVDGALCSADNKTSRRRMAADDAEKALQPTAYAYLKNEPIDFAFTRVIDTGKSVSTETVWTSRNERDIEGYREILNQVETAWEIGLFPPNPTSTFCGPNRCAFWARCPVGVGRTYHAVTVAEPPKD